MPVRAKLLVPIMALGIAVAATGCLPSVDAGPPVSHDGLADRINADRASDGQSPLAVDAQLDQIAQHWAEQMAATGNLAHQDLNGLAHLTGWMALSENLFVGPPGSTAGMVESSWLSSPEHRANLLDGGMTSFGIGVARDASGRTWVVVDFGAR